MRTLLLLACAAVLGAADLYVSAAAAGTQNGGFATPFATIQQGIDAAQPGDTVHVRAGTYTPTQSIGVWGKTATATSRITIRGHQDERPIIDGSAVTSHPPNAFAVGSPYVTVQGFEIRNAKQVGLLVWKSHHIVFRDIIVHHSHGGGIAVDSDVLHGSSDVLVEDCVAWQNVLMNQARTLTGGWGSGFGAGKSDRVTFRNNIAYNNHGEGMLCYLADGCVMQDNVAYDNYSCMYYLDNATHCVVERNLAYATGDTAWHRFGFPATGFQAADEDYGSVLVNRSRGNTVRNNVFVDVRCAFYFGDYHATGGSLRDFLYAHNTCYGAKDVLLHFDSTPGAHSNAQFVGNIFQQTGSAALVRHSGSWTGLSGRANLWRGGSGTAGGLAGAGDQGGDPLFAAAGAITAASYRLGAGSAALDRLTVLAAVPSDFAGVARPQGAGADLGAWERGASSNQAPTIAVAAQASATVLVLP